MDYLTLIGVLLALLAVLGGNILEGGHTGSLLQLTSFVIVFGGTVGAILVQTPLAVFKTAVAKVKWVFFPPQMEPNVLIGRVVDWSRLSRKQGLLSLQQVADKEPDAFIQKGLMLLVDGTEPDDIRKMLEQELDSRAAHDFAAAKVYEGMGGYSPTVGIIGAVLGLIHVMNNLADPSSLGPGIAVAFVATIYGVGLANFFYLPIANKLKAIIGSVAQYREMLIEGLVSIAEGENPKVIESRLKSFVVNG